MNLPTLSTMVGMLDSDRVKVAIIINNMTSIIINNIIINIIIINPIYPRGSISAPSVAYLRISRQIHIRARWINFPPI